MSVGDSNKVYFHQINGGSQISFTPITTLTIPPPDTSSYPSPSLTAAFSTAFSGDGSKFAVASQEGVVAVWDVRSTRPLKVFHTDKSRGTGPNGLVGNGGASGWLSDEPWEWTRGTKAPGWCVRSVKFNRGEGGRMGKEVMAFTEVCFLFHIFSQDPTNSVNSTPPLCTSSTHERLRLTILFAYRPSNDQNLC